MPSENESVPAKSLFKVFLNGYAKIFDFKNRASKYDFWGFAFCNALLAALFITVWQLGFNGNFLIKFLIEDLFYFTTIVMFVAFLSLTVRRLHDIGGSGKFLLIGLVLLYISNPRGGYGLGLIILIVPWSLLFIWGLYLFIKTVQRGQPETNAYGEPVKEKKICNTWANIMILSFIFIIIVFLIIIAELA